MTCAQAGRDPMFSPVLLRALPLFDIIAGMETIYEENPCGGKGTMKLEKLLSPAEMGDKCGLYARVTLPPGAVLGYHEHHGNKECYFMLSGEGVYDDNGEKRVIRAGDVTWTADGCGHGLSNEDGKEDVVFMALIINS